MLEQNFYAAIARHPEGGFQMKDALSREEVPKGFTIWSAYSNFKENEKERIEPLKVDQFCNMRQRYDTGAFNRNAINKANSHQISTGKNVK